MMHPSCLCILFTLYIPVFCCLLLPGPRCEEEVNPCRGVDCGYGICEPTPLLTYRCICARGFTGPRWSQNATHGGLSVCPSVCLSVCPLVCLYCKISSNHTENVIISCLCPIRVNHACTWTCKNRTVVFHTYSPTGQFLPIISRYRPHNSGSVPKSALSARRHVSPSGG